MRRGVKTNLLQYFTESKTLVRGALSASRKPRAYRLAREIRRGAVGRCSESSRAASPTLRRTHQAVSSAWEALQHF